ncbi:hypothetical protein P12x_002721 [Tundrisphaera lichenicola]
MAGACHPAEGRPFCGVVRIEGRTGVMTAALNDIEGKTVYSVALEPAA